MAKVLDFQNYCKYLRLKEQYKDLSLKTAGLINKDSVMDSFRTATLEKLERKVKAAEEVMILFLDG